jgi:hypothetical protein
MRYIADERYFPIAMAEMLEIRLANFSYLHTSILHSLSVCGKWLITEITNIPFHKDMKQCTSWKSRASSTLNAGFFLFILCKLRIDE